MAAMPAAHCARLHFLSFQPTWHPSSFKSQFKHHFLREVSLQAQPGPMLPLKTTLHAFITHADVYASGWWFHSCLSPPVDYQLLRRQAVCLYSSLNPKKLNIVEARLMCVGWRNKINQSMDIKWDDIYQVIIIIIGQCTLITIPQHITLNFRYIESRIINIWPYKYFIPSANCPQPTTDLSNQCEHNL